MKKCPYCAEEIQDEAIVCRYCGRDITNFKNKQKISGIKERQHQNSYNSSAWKQGAKLAFVFAILGAIGLYLRNPNFSTIYFIDLLVGFVFWWLIISLWIMLWRWLGQRIMGG